MTCKNYRFQRRCSPRSMAVREPNDTQVVRKIWKDDRGQDIAEYAVMLALILVLVVGTVKPVGSNANNAFSSVANSLQ